VITLRPNQQTALALLGYKLWLPRAELAALRAAPPAAPATTTVPVAANPVPAAATTATTLPLPGIAASVHLTRDYTLLSGEALRCNWLMPPLWSEAGRLMPFASENERRLLLALFHAIDCDEALRLFTAWFDLARAAPLPVPAANPAPPADLDAKPLITCGEALQTAGSAFGKTTLKVYNFLHPYTALSDMTQKNTLWRQWEEIKRSLF
jgi:membrane protein